jgi:hypothetical protein
LKDEHKKLCGVLVLHVDDGLLCGKGKHYEKSLEKLQTRAPLKVWKNQGLRFTGRSVTQNPKTHEIDLTQKGYFDDVEPISVDKRRRAHPDAVLTALEIKQLRSLIGKLAWPARGTMPQISPT